MSAVKTDKFAPDRGYDIQDWNEVCDNPEWTEEDFRDAKSFAEVFPELAAASDRQQAEQEAEVARSGGSRSIVSLVIDTDVLERFQAAGDDWKERINEVLKKAVA